MNSFLHCVAASSYSSCSPGFVCFAYGTRILTPPLPLRLARRFGVSQTSTGSSRSSLENGGRERDRSSGSDDDDDDGGNDDDSSQQNTSDAGREIK